MTALNHVKADSNKVLRYYQWMCSKRFSQDNQFQEGVPESFNSDPLLFYQVPRFPVTGFQKKEQVCASEIHSGVFVFAPRYIGAGCPIHTVVGPVIKPKLGREMRTSTWFHSTSEQQRAYSTSTSLPSSSFPSIFRTQEN
jgi:hypothetical protein